MYCIKCGVELKDSEKRCPLCGTPVFHPDIKQPKGEKPYPEFYSPGYRLFCTAGYFDGAHRPEDKPGDHMVGIRVRRGGCVLHGADTSVVVFASKSGDIYALHLCVGDIVPVVY